MGAAIRCFVAAKFDYVLSGLMRSVFMLFFYLFLLEMMMGTPRDYHVNTAGMGTIFTVIPWVGDKAYSNIVVTGAIVQQTAVLKLRIIVIRTTKCLFCSLCRYWCLLPAW